MPSGLVKHGHDRSKENCGRHDENLPIPFAFSSSSGED